jgi:poly-gamma-glutamate capsule biosynthesis protein CapA/YwtB (metallophosphatase superfamily)
MAGELEGGSKISRYEFEGLRLSWPLGRFERWPAGRLVPAFTLLLWAVPFFSSSLPGQEQEASPAEFSLTLTGDSIITTPASTHQKDPRFMAVVDAIRRGDAAFTNLELTFPGADTYPAGLPRAGLIASDPAMLKELQWIGFNLFGAANNHSLDYGIQGLLDTIQVLKQDGAVYAGIGENLGQARAPGYLSTEHGRVALVTCASTFQADSPAGQARPDMRGRPGLNPLRHDTRYRVDATTFEALRKMKNDLHLTGAQGESGAPQTLEFSFPASSIYPLSVTFELSDKPGVVTTPDPRDLEALTHSIRDARAFSDYVVVSIHAHEGMPGADPLEVPAQFLVEFAHAAIDAGADALVASGPHVLRGIETYKGKVIFYSLGNFIFENWLVVPEPTEYYERFGLGLEALPSEAYEARSDHGRRDEPANSLYWQSVVAHVVFRNGRPRSVTLTPFTLGFGRRAPDRGYPELADPAAAAEILGRLQKLSQPFGTAITIRNGVGSITIQ